MLKFIDPEQEDENFYSEANTSLVSAISYITTIT